jgi:serine/threonine protein kinase
MADEAEDAFRVTTPLPGAVAPGLRLKGRYLVEKELGRGGIGVVYLARDEQLHNRPVVIKVLLDRSAESEWFQKKFKQELQALVRIDHPGVVGALDAGEMPDGKPFFVMQFVQGVTLRSVMKEGRLGVREVASIVRQVGGALSAAHEKGVHHRDLKPENIMLQDLGHGERLAKIIDFGIATVQDPEEEGTQYTQIAGSVFYMAPEQLLGKPQAASDTYALGVIAYEMLTGEPPFRPGSPYELPALQLQGVKVKPTQRRPDLSADVDTAVLKALALDPKNRPATARAFAEELSLALTTIPPRPATAEPTFRVPSQAPSAPAAEPTFRVPTPSTTSGPPQPTELDFSPALEMAHVLFMDIVGYSTLPMDHQRDALGQLQTIVQATEDFRRAQAARELVSLPTGDGMALVFFRDPTAPLRCSVDVARALKGHPQIRLRMGLHGGPVYRVADINANLNVAGGGINVAQRVMDCGDAGHILLSRAVADVASQLSQWSAHLHDLGEHPVKHGVQVHLFNLYTGDLGNPAMPSKLRAVLAEAPRAQQRPPLPREERKSRVLAMVLVGLAVLVAGGVAAALLLGRKPAPGAGSSTPVAFARELAYFLTVQKYRNGQPYREPFQLAREMLFGPDDRLRLTVASPQTGYLYIINEGPEPTGGKPSYNVLFPTTTTGGGSALLAAGQEVQIPEKSWFKFDEVRGTERLWLALSAREVPELEAVKGLANPKDKGAIRDPGQIDALQAFLARQPPPPLPREAASKRTRLKGQGDVLVSLLKLEHQ